MRFTNFLAGCFGKVIGGIMCILLGVVLAFGGTALAGYIVLTRDGMMGKVEDLAQSNNLPVDFEEDVRGLSLLDWGKSILPVFKDLTTTPIGELESVLGVGILSSTLGDITGLEISVLKASTLGDLGKTFTENLTVEQASDKFGIAFPDLPVFKKDTFLESPLSTAFESMEEFELQDFVEVTEDSSPILQSLKDMQIGQMSDPENGLDKRINELMLKEVITIDENSNKILKKLEDTKVGELGSTETNNLIMTMKLEEVIDLEEGVSPAALWALREVPIGDLGDSSTDQIIKNMKLADLMDIDETSSPILRYFKANNTTLAGKDESEQPNGVNEALKVMTLGDMIEITDPELPGGSTKLMWALKDCPLETIPADDDNPAILGIEDQIKIVPLNELLEVGTTHIWIYLGTATIEDLGAKIDDMNMSDVIEITEISPEILRKMRPFNPLIDTAGNEALFGTEEIKVSELNTKLEPLVQDMTLGELIDINASSEPILLALKDTKISNLNSRIASLQINEVFSEAVYNYGVLSLVDSDTLINDIASELTTTVSTAVMQRLINAGIMTAPSLSNEEINAGIRNRTINEIITDYSLILNNISADPPVPPSTSMAPQRHYLTASDTIIDTAFLSSLAGFDEGETLVLGANTTIAAENFLTIFNIMTNGHILTIEEGATIRSATFDGTEYHDKGGFMFISSSPYTGVSGGGSIASGSVFSDPTGIKDNDKIEIKII